MLGLWDCERHHSVAQRLFREFGMSASRYHHILSSMKFVGHRCCVSRCWQSRTPQLLARLDVKYVEPPSQLEAHALARANMEFLVREFLENKQLWASKGIANLSYTLTPESPDLAIRAIVQPLD
jgi:hypothetical protein